MNSRERSDNERPLEPGQPLEPMAPAEGEGGVPPSQGPAQQSTPGVPPYQPPAAAPPPAVPGAPLGQPGGIGAWLNEAWALVTANLGMAIVSALLPVVPAAIALVPLSLGLLPLLKGHTGPAVGLLVVGVLLALLLLVLAMPAILLGIFACYWEATQTRRLTLDRLADGLGLYLPGLALWLLFIVVFFVLSVVANAIPLIGALIAFVVQFPIAAWVALSLYHLIASRGGVVEAITVGWKALMADPLNLSVMGLLCWVINLAGTLVCGVGTLFTTPLTAIAWAVCYRDMRARAGA